VGLSELRWPSGSVIIQIDELSVGLQSVFSNHKEQILTTEYSGLLNVYIFHTKAGGRKSVQPTVSSDQTGVSLQLPIQF
jgi:hypothetical protein